jgi:hypothetical protein
MRPFAAITLALLATGCGPKRQALSGSAPTALVADGSLSDPAVGTVDATGKLVIHVFDPQSKRPARVHLSTEYGVLLFRNNNGVRFAIAEQAGNSVREFDIYEDYLKALATLPKGSTLTVYDRCTVPLFYDFYPLHQEMYQKFTRDCRKRGLKVAKEEKIICTCGTEA